MRSAEAETGVLPSNNSVILTLAHRAKELRRSAAQNDAYAQYALGVLYSHGAKNVPKDPVKAEYFWKKAARAGLVDAQARLAILYSAGDGIARNHNAARFWFSRAAKQGDLSSQYNLGVMHAQGWGGAPDYAQAAHWWRLSAARGNVEAQYHLAVLYWEGRGVPKDYKKARRWLLRAAVQNHAGAQHVLGIFAREGWGGKRDLRAAKHWLEQAGLKDLSAAQYDLASLYEREAIKKSRFAPAQRISLLRDAYIWFSLAANKNYENAPAKRDRIARQIPQSLRAEADRTALYIDFQDVPDEEARQVYIPNQVHAFQASIEKIDAQTLRLSGTLSLNTPDKLEDALKKYGNISTLALESGGGLLTSGLIIAKIVKKYGLRTRAENQCNSACTFVLFASPQPTSQPKSIIGFHRAATAIGADVQNLPRNSDQRAEWLFKNHYAWVGFPPSFIEKILETPHKGLHIFSKEDLIRANLLKSIYEPQTARYVSAKIWCGRNARLCKARPRFFVKDGAAFVESPSP